MKFIIHIPDTAIDASKYRSLDMVIEKDEKTVDPTLNR